MEEREKQISDGLRFAEEVKIKLEDVSASTQVLKEASEEAQKTSPARRQKLKINFAKMLKHALKILSVKHVNRCNWNADSVAGKTRICAACRRNRHKGT